MLYPLVALERAMTIREVVLCAMSGEITWMLAAEIIGCTPRSVRQWQGRFMRDGYFGLLDRRRGRPGCAGRRSRRHGHERIAIALEPSLGAVHRVMPCPVAGSTMKYCQYAACLTRVHHVQEFLGTFVLTISYSESIGPTPNSHLRLS